jgi:hypothetical protein
MISEDARAACIRMAVLAVREGEADAGGTFYGLYEVAGEGACREAALELGGTPGQYCAACDEETVSLPPERDTPGRGSPVCAVCWSPTYASEADAQEAQAVREAAFWLAVQRDLP